MGFYLYKPNAKTILFIVKNFTKKRKFIKSTLNTDIFILQDCNLLFLT